MDKGTKMEKGILDIDGQWNGHSHVGFTLDGWAGDVSTVQRM